MNYFIRQYWKIIVGITCIFIGGLGFGGVLESLRHRNNPPPPVMSDSDKDWIDSTLASLDQNLSLTDEQKKLIIPQIESTAREIQLSRESALLKLSDYVVIRRRDVPMQALMDPQWEGLVRQNLRMLLEQAQVALLSGNQGLYQQSLGRAQHWVAQFFDSDEAAAQAMAREITQLEGQVVAVDLPDISRSLRALDEAMEQRLQQGGAE